MGTTKGLLVIAISLICPLALAQESAAQEGSSVSYTADARLNFPGSYREWVYLTSGFDMSYSAAANGSGHHLFDNLFVNPASYRAFERSGRWPDGTVLVLELRRAGADNPLNKQGSFQGTAVVGVEVHVRDSARFAGGWAFYSFGGTGSSSFNTAAKVIPHSADCYACHTAHGAVDTTFVQFYPTLLPLARTKGTLFSSSR